MLPNVPILYASPPQKYIVFVCAHFQINAFFQLLFHSMKYFCDIVQIPAVLVQMHAVVVYAARYI